MDIEKLLPEIRKNVFLKDYTTFKIGGKAKYFFVAKNRKEIIKAIKTAKKLKIPFFILGGGSNILVSDQGFNGIVIKCQMSNVKCQNRKIYAEAGVPLSLLVNVAIDNNLTGLEWAAGIPGTIGGAIRGNAGAFGNSIADIIEEVEVFDINDLKIKKIKKDDCKFSYRNSIFKKNKNLIILSAKIKLKKGNKIQIRKIVKERIKYRKSKHPLKFPSAGSVFKNVDLKKIPKKRRDNFSKVIKKDPFMVIPAAYLISEAGLKGLKVGQAKISEEQPNFILNLGRAKAKDVIKLIGLIKKRVKNKFKILLEEENQYLDN